MKIRLLSVTKFDDGVTEEHTLSVFYSNQVNEKRCLERALSRALFLSSTRSTDLTSYCLEIVPSMEQSRTEVFPKPRVV